jgi:L-iditol 2-dehydrogenase
MKAAEFEKPFNLVVKDFKKPIVKAGEILIKVHSCALCGSDIRIFKGEKKIDVPITGHEISGVIESIGSGIKGYKIGDHVAIETVIGCSSCLPCKSGYENLCLKGFSAIGYQYNGGFAEYVKMPKNAVNQGCVIKIPKKLDFDEVTLIEPLSCVINGLDNLNIKKGSTVAIFGAGLMGCLCVEYAKILGASKVILINRSLPRINLAKKIKLCADEFVVGSDPVDSVMKLTKGVGVDAAVCAASVKEVQKSALEITAVNGHVSYFAGISKDDPFNKIDTNLIHYKELHIHGANSSNLGQYRKALKLISSGKINASKFITHKFDLKDINTAFKVLQDRSKGALKVVIRC